MPSRPQLQRDEWLSHALGRESFHLTSPPMEELSLVLADAPPGAFVDCRVDVTKEEATSSLIAAGALLVDTNVTFERPGAETAKPGAGVREALPEDRDVVARIAAEAFAFSRFARDPHLGPAVNARLKASWVSNFFAGRRGNRLLLGEVDGRVAGFLLLIDRDEESVIDLIAVDAAHRRRGVAERMVAAAAQDGRRLRVGTQLANVPSIRLYETLGFRFVGAAHVLHLHLGTP